MSTCFKRLSACFVLFSIAVLADCQAVSQELVSPPIALVIHGGAGTISKENMTPEKEQRYHQKLREALNAGYNILARGGSSLEAVTAAIVVMENSTLFNAGKGAVFAANKTNELDASVMTGHNLQAGAVAGVGNVKNPILAARKVMENSPHLLLMGKGAEQFAQEQGLEQVQPSYFFTQERYDQLLEVQQRESAEGSRPPLESDKFGTVGAVALDKKGNLAAGTSTGGMTNKRYGRVGDSPIIGAGTFADNASCGVSCTGHGEYFMRTAAAYDVAARMKYLGLTLEEAAKEVVTKIAGLGGSGGLVALDAHGRVAMSFNTPGMYRGFIREGELPQTFIFK